MGVISEDKVREYIVPFLSVGKRGFKSKLCLTKVMLLILMQLKTGCQWRELSIKEYFYNGEVCWQTIYYYFNKWSRDGSFKRVCVNA
ncbi:MAG: transposase [Flavobacterium sp.]|nr:transposase [Flavobacterium sp.]